MRFVIVTVIAAFALVFASTGTSSVAKPYTLTAPSSVTCPTGVPCSFNVTVTNNTSSDVSCSVYTESFGFWAPYPTVTVVTYDELGNPVYTQYPNPDATVVAHSSVTRSISVPYVTGSGFPSKLTLDLFCGDPLAYVTTYAGFVKGQSKNVTVR